METVQLAANVVDQYGEVVEAEIEWCVAQGTTLKDRTDMKGVRIDIRMVV